MPGTDIDIAHLIDTFWVRFSPEEQQQIEQRAHDLILLSLSRALEGAVSPSEAAGHWRGPDFAGPPAAVPGPSSAPAPGELRVSAADVPFGDASNYRDYSYDDFARLAEDHGVPPVSAIGHWFGKSLGIEFDKSTPEIRRKVYAEMKAVYESVKDSVPIGPAGGRPPMAVVQPAYVQPALDSCPQCGHPAKYVQGGISKKTGKPYTGFYACDNKPQCTTFYQGQNKGLTWTVDRDWTAAYNRAHAS